MTQTSANTGKTASKPAAPAGTAHDTPAMRQVRRFKEQHPDCVLFFRMGDFYEMFYDDAKLAHKVLGVTLTQRTEGIPMAGVPYHAVEGYLRRMIQAGYRVAVCDQVEDPKQARGVVKRDVTRVITPGTLTDESLLDEGRDNPLAAVMFHDDQHASVAWAELSTGAFSVARFHADELADELARVGPSELLYVETANGAAPGRVSQLAQALGCATAARPAWQFRQAEAVESLQRQFGVASLSGFGFEDGDAELGPAAAIVHYLLETQCAADEQGRPRERIAHLRPPRRFDRGAHLVIDQTSLRSLEVERTVRSGAADGSLLSVMRTCVTAMGKRMLRHWLCYPLCDREAIEVRQRVVQALVDDARFADELRDALDGVQDVQRIAGRIAVGRASPRDLVALGKSSAKAAALADLLAERPTVTAHRERIVAIADALGALAGRITDTCVDSPPAHLREGGLIRDGVDAALDEVRGLQRDSNTWLAQYQKSLIDDTGITSLKVGYNKVFGFYIELTAANSGKAPDAWSRKQTLKNAERYITPELKDYEGKVLSAEQRAINREQDLFADLCAAAAERLDELDRFAQIVAELDVLACFADRAVRHRYVRPTLVDQPVLDIRDGRHPVLDERLGDQFVPNDITLGVTSDATAEPSSDRGTEPSSDRGTERPSDQAADKSAEAPHPASPSAPRSLGPSVPSLALITGPNMAGKSTYIRQAALIALLAHTGSFVPAASATVGLTDRIFTRIGASDELHTGQSTFMVEMTETANICHHATERSLVILDEIGRGTSTLDGLSLAWAIAEHLAQRRARTLFATHYHELTALAERFDNVANLHVTVREWQDRIVFLHRIAHGSTDRSYGIHVAKIAGLPEAVVARANELLSQLAVSHQAPDAPAREQTPMRQRDAQLSLFTEYVDHPVIDELKAIDINQLTPIQAFDLLREWRDRLAD